LTEKLAKLEAKARAEGKTVSELAERLLEVVDKLSQDKKREI